MESEFYRIRQSHDPDLLSSAAQYDYARALQPFFKQNLANPATRGIDTCLGFYHTLTRDEERRITLAELLNQFDWHKDQTLVGKTSQDPATLIIDYQKIMALGNDLDTRNPELDLKRPEWGPARAPATLRLKFLDGYGHTLIYLTTMCLVQHTPETFAQIDQQHIRNVQDMLACLPDTSLLKQTPQQVSRSALQAFSALNDQYPTLFQHHEMGCTADFLAYLQLYFTTEL